MIVHILGKAYGVAVDKFNKSEPSRNFSFIRDVNDYHFHSGQI